MIGSLKSIYFSEIKPDIEKASGYEKNIISEQDIINLPPPVQRHFRFCGYIGKVKMINAKTEWEDIRFKRSQNGKWMHLDCLQYNSIPKPTRIVYMQNKIAGIFPFEARDKYQNGKGNMLIRLLNLFTIADAKGIEMDKSGLVTVLSEIAILPTYALQDYISWEAIDDNNAKATLSDNDITVSGTFNFSNEGAMCSFYSEDRFFAEKNGTFKNIPWSIAIDKYAEKDDMKFPKKMRVKWHLKDHDLEYFKGEVSNIDYNVIE